MVYCYYDSPLGQLLLTGGEALESLHFPVGRTRMEPEKDWVLDPGKFRDALFQLEAYFRGSLRRFDLKLSPRGTEFQKSVWQALLNIPYGETLSYGELASRMGNPRAARAVGMANGRNPISIIIPCHRVIGKGGDLTGFGGGLEVKQRLLDLEKRGRQKEKG